VFATKAGTKILQIRYFVAAGLVGSAIATCPVCDAIEKFAGGADLE